MDSMEATRLVGPALELGPPQRAERLTVFPLTTREEVELPYRLLAEALEAGTLEITEVGSGTVPTLRVRNGGEEDVLVLDGEQLVGAKQNRMTNRTLILPAKRETEIPVSCMERGRWHDVGRTFRSAPQHAPSKVRRKARKQEAMWAARGLEASPDVLAGAQHEVWSEIGEKLHDLGVSSGTEALDHLYAARQRELAEWAERFRAVDGQVGLLAFMDGEPLGLDVVGGRAHWARLHDRILQGYLMDALRGRARRSAAVAGGASTSAPSGASGEAGPDDADALRFLAAVRSARRSEASTVGKGTYRVLGGVVMGAELTDASRQPQRPGALLAHRCAFPTDDEGGPGRIEQGRPPIAGPRTRRGRHR